MLAGSSGEQPGPARAGRGGLGFIERRYLLALARMSVEQRLAGGSLGIRAWEAPSEDIVREGACFVTIDSGGSLRGCIGTLKAFRPLVEDVIRNAEMSAFEDERFRPLSRAELGSVRFSISVLEEPSPLEAGSAGELLGQIAEGKHGLIVRKGASMATYLPHVWRVHRTKEQFLSNLCLKAGLGSDEWMAPRGMEFLAYLAQEFSELEPVRPASQRFNSSDVKKNS